MNSIRRIAPTNLLPPQLSKQDSPFPRNRARVLSACLPACLPAAPSLAFTHAREGGRYSSESNYPTGASGFWYRRLQSIRRSGHPPRPTLRFSALTLFVPDENNRRMRAAECPRNTLVRGRPPVKMRKTRHCRILDSAILRKRVVPPSAIRYRATIIRLVVQWD